VEIGDQRVVIPMEVRSGRPVLQIRINGEGPFPFVLDTGNPGRVILEQRLFRRLGLPALGEDRIGGPINPDSLSTSVTRLESLEFDGLRMRGVSAMAWHRPPMFRGADPVQGILGRRLFADLLVTLDYVRERLVVWRGALPAPDGATIFGWRPDEPHPTVPIRIGDLQVRAHVDSGNPRDVLLHVSHEARLPPRIGRVIRRSGRTANGQFQLRCMRVDAPLQIGALSFPRPWVGVTQAIEHPNIGGSILRLLAVTLDQSNRRLRFERPS